MNILNKIYKISMVKWLSIPCCMAVIMLFSLQDVHATHIVGGDITYRCLGNDNYEVTLTVRRDCEFGEEPFDSVAYVGIFDNWGSMLPYLGIGGMIQMTDPTITTINTALDQGCAFIGEPVCVTQAVYKGIVNLPTIKKGYQLVYQRCCRNQSLDNIVDPLNAGSTYMIHLTEESMKACNNSPTFNQWPDVYICTDQTLSFDMSASDADGDSLVYKLCAPLSGGTFDNPQPVPPSGGPFTEVEYKAPFSWDNPIDGQGLQIDAQTGLLTAVPSSVGQWLVGLCVEEYRDGKLISTVRRDFQYNTRICTAGPMASFDVPNPYCDGLEFTVTNTSTDADSYTWKVSPSDGVSFDANAAEPTFAFPKDGKYTISLEAFRDLDGCSTTYTNEIGVFDSKLQANFESEIKSCSPTVTSIELKSTSTDPTYTIAESVWYVTINNVTDTLNGDVINFDSPLIDDVQVTLIVTADNGCSASITKTVDADPLDLELITNNLMVCSGEKMEIIKNPNCDLTYTISPMDDVILDDPNDPCVISIAPTANRTYIVTATDGFCTATAELTTSVTEKSDLQIIADDVFCSDKNVNIELTGALAGNIIEWSTDPNFASIIGDGTSVLTTDLAKGKTVFYARVKEGSGCSDVVSKEITNGTIDVNYETEFVACLGLNETIQILNNNNDQVLDIIWKDNPIIVSSSNTEVVILVNDVNTKTTLEFEIKNQYGCSEKHSINVSAEEKPDVDFSTNFNCGTFEMCFNNVSNPLGSEVSWDFGDPNTNQDVATGNNVCYTYPALGAYTVTMTLTSGGCAGEAISKQIQITELPSLEVDVKEVLCLGEKSIFTANPKGTGGSVYWIVGNDTLATGNSFEFEGTEKETILKTVYSDINGCEAIQTNTIQVRIYDMEISGPDIICENAETVLEWIDKNPLNNPDYSFEWSPADLVVSGQGTSKATVKSDVSTTISLKVTDNTYGCDTTLVFDFDVSSIDAELIVNPEEPYQCKEVEIQVDPANDNWTYEWESGEKESTITDTIMQDKVFKVTITDENGCTEVLEVLVKPIIPNCDESDVFLPNAFSPDNNGVNDYFLPRSNFIKKMEFAVFNRWGERVYYTTDVKTTGWDGTYNGSDLKPDVYAYQLIVTCSNGEQYKKIGNVTLVR